MPAQPVKLNPHEISMLLRGETVPLAAWIAGWEPRRLALHAAAIVLGAGGYGAAMGWWRAPEQALFVAIKFPLIILLTTLGNALLNAMLAPLLGLNLTLRQSLLAVLMSFSVTAAILGAFAPLAAFLAWNAPPMSPTWCSAGGTYSVMMLAHVAVIAGAGIAGNARLFQLLARLGGGRAVALRVWLAWLAGNLFLGSQLSWILRPFIGAPNLPVEFFRANAMAGGFFESVFNSFVYLFKLIFL